MRNDQAAAAEVGLVESDGGFGAGSCGPGGHRGYGDPVVVSMAWDRPGDVVRRWPDVEPADLGVDLTVDRKREVLTVALRACQWAIVVASFTWVVTWWT